MLQAGKFDENFPYPAGEDVDLCLKVAALGKQIYFEPRAVVYHHHRRLTLRDTWSRFVKYGAAWAQVRLGHRKQWRAFDAVFRVLRRAPWLMLVLSPLIIVVNILQDAIKNPLVFVYYWYTLPAFVWSNLAWVWGAVQYLVRQND